MVDFRIYKPGVTVTLVPIKKDPTTVIAAGKMVTVDVNELAIVADATSTKLAYAPAWASVWDSFVLVVKDTDVLYRWTSAVNFAQTDCWKLIDMSVASTVQKINNWATAVWVFQVWVWIDTGVVWYKTDYAVKIEKHLLNA